VLLPDINHSEHACSLEQVNELTHIRLGLDYVHGLGEAYQARITECRGDGPFKDLRDFCRHTRLPRKVIETLIRSGAMDSFGKERRELLWELGGLIYDTGLDLQVPVQPVDLPKLSDLEQTLWEYELLGLTPEDHLMGFYRERLRKKGVLSSQELGTRQDGEIVWVAGLVVVRQRPPSAKGYVFVTLEDEEGLMNLIIKPRVYERYRDVVHRASVLLAQAALQVTERQVNLIVSQLAVLGY
jgi:error-prone DNA polymerase